MSAAREILVRAGVVKSFLQVPGITAVRFTVENEELLDSRGNPVGDMTEDTFAEFTGNEPDAYCSNTFTLYFTDKEGTHLVKEQRTVRYKRTIPREHSGTADEGTHGKRTLSYHSGEYGASECNNCRRSMLCGI